jgi:hypothetical protein
MLAPKQGTVMALDWDADIVPGIEAAGLRLGASIATAVQTYAALFTAESLYDALKRPTGLRYHSPNVDLWSHDGTIAQIMVYGNYRGRLAHAIGLGSTIADIETLIGPCIEDDEDNLIVTNLPGISFEIGATYADPDWRHAPIIEMYVFPT